MKDFTDDYKLSVRSLEEVDAILRLLGSVAAPIRYRKFQRRSSKTTKMSIVNALLVWVAALPREEQFRVLREGHELLDKILAGENPGDRELTRNAEVTPPRRAAPKSQPGPRKTRSS